MTDTIKTRPDDGSEEEKEEEEKEAEEKEAEMQEAEQEKKRKQEEETFESFTKEAEEGYKEMEQRKKEILERLRKERGHSWEEDEDKDKDKNEDPTVATAKKPERLFEGDKIEPQKTFTADKGAGIFDHKGNRFGFGTANVKTRIERTLRTGAKGVAIKKQREFMQLLGKYHGLKEKNLGNLEKDELGKFQAGLRRGASDMRFKEFGDELKKEGVIKNSADVKRLFSRGEIKKISNALMGKKDPITYKRVDRTELVNKRRGGVDSGQPLRPTR